jgi:hypothetical protein
MTVVVRRLFLVATPLALAVILWFHPPSRALARSISTAVEATAGVAEA